MRLLDLDPRWFVLEQGEQRVGLTFQCPHCRSERLSIYFHNRGEELIDDTYIRARVPDAKIWTVEGAEDFAVLTITPSIDASASGHWHGFVRNGEVT